MDHFSDANGPSIALNAASGDAKFAVDLWDETAGKYTFEKFGSQFGLRDKFNSMNAAVNGQSIAQEEGVHTNNFMYLWVNSAEQLQGIQTFYKNGLDGGSNDTEALHYNYALKQDINASNLTGYTAIGTGSDGTWGPSMAGAIILSVWMRRKDLTAMCSLWNTLVSSRKSARPVR